MTKDKLYRESVVHRSGGLPMKIYDSCYVGYHWHDEYEFLLPKNGIARCTVGGRQLNLHEDEALMICGGELHSLHLDVGRSVTAIVVHPSFWWGEECAEIFERLQFPALFSERDEVGAEIINALRQIKQLYREAPFGYEVRLKSLFCSIFARLLESGAYEQRELTEKPDFSTEGRLFEYVHSHFSEQITLDSLCNVTHYSKSYIIRLFKKHTGQTPTEYINRYRVERAKEALSRGERSVLEVSLECGFASVSYFIKIFKQYTGTTPHRWVTS